jgi:hypothetical protein
MKNILRNSSSEFTKWCVALIAAGWMGAAQAEAQAILTEDFNFSGTLIANGWTLIGTASVNPITTVGSTGLIYPGSPASNIGNSASLLTSGEDNYKSFTSQTTGAVYASFLINVSAAQASGDYFVGLSSSTTSYEYRLFAKSNGAGYSFGVSKSNGTVQYDTALLSFGTTYLVVIKYAYSSGTTTDDTLSFWLNPALGGNEGTPTLSRTDTAKTDATTLGMFILRQGAAANSATLKVDGIRVGTSWTAVTASAAIPPTVTTSASVSAISSSGATLGGSISDTGGANATETGIFYSTTSGFANGAGTKVSATGLNQGIGAFTQVVTGLSQNTTYYFKAFAANSAGSGYGAEQSFTTAAVAQVPPSVTAAPSATVDGNIEMTFTDNPSYRAAITDIKVGGASLPAGAFSTASAGKIVLSPSASPFLQSSGSKIITITATGYEPLNVTQLISHGAATKLGILTQAVAPAANGAAFATQPVVAVQDKYGNTVLTSTETVTAAVGSGGWILGGVAGVPAVNGVATFSGLTAGKVGTLTGGTISFSSGALTGATFSDFGLPLPLLTISTSNSYSEGVIGQSGTITIPFAAPADISVTLNSSSAVDLKVDDNGVEYAASTTVLIAAGTSTAEFFMDVPADNSIDGNASVTLTASSTGFANGTKAITVENVDYVAPTIVINKFYNSGVNSPAGADDVVELLVIGNGTPGATVNLQGMLIKDYSSSGVSDGGGAYIFASNALWSAVKAGTLIVLTKPGTTPPAEDVDVSDFVLRVNLSNTAYFTAGTGTMDIGATEMVQIKAAGSVQAGSTGAIHSFAVGTSTATQVAAAPLPKLICAASGNNPYAKNSTRSVADFNGTDGVQGGSPLGTGIGNNSDNSTFISSLRGSKDISIGVDSTVAIINEDAGLQAGKITVSLSQPADSNQTVSLSATPSGAATIPSSVVIPSGSSSATVDFTPISDNVVAGNRTVTIAGSATGWTTGNNTATVVDVQFNNPSVVINELVNGGTGGADALELLVIQNNLNMVGMILKDFSTNMTGDAGAQYTFKDVALWQSVKMGTLIVLTNNAAATEDTDASDGLVTLKLTNTTYFTAAGSFDISNTDMVMIKAAGSGTAGIGGAIHTFGNGTAGSLFKLANGGKLLFAAGGAGGGADNATSTIGDYNGTGATAGNTLGAANNASNQTYVTALRNSAGPIAPSSLSYTPSSISGTVGVAISSLTPTVTGTVDTYSVSPALPSGLSINASSGVISGTPTAIAASASYTVTASNSGGSTTATVTVAVAKGTPSITAVPTASAITNGQALSASVLSGGTASVAGTFTWTTPSTVPAVGTATYGVTFTPTDTANYNTATTTVSLTVNPAGTTYSGWRGAAPASDEAFWDYVFGAATPGTLDPSLKPTVAITGGNLVLTYNVRQGTVGLTVTPKTSADLAAVPSGWVTTDVIVADVGAARTVNGVSVQQKTASVPVSGTKKFLRVEAVQQ